MSENKTLTIDELIKSDLFVANVDKNIRELKSRRIHRHEPEPGFYFKRDWYDRMRDEKILNTDFFLENIKSIWLKESSLSSEIRNVILFVCDKAAHEVILASMEVGE